MNWPVDNVVLNFDPLRPKNTDARGIAVMETAPLDERGLRAEHGSRVHPWQRKSGVVGFGETLLAGPVELHVGEPAPT